MDRMIPGSIWEVSSTFGQPVKLVALEGALGIAFFLLTLLGFNPVIYLWWSTLLFPSFVFPAICALRLPRRRPEMMNKVPWRRFLMPLAIVWLVIIVPFYIFAGFIGSFPPLAGGLSLWQYAISTGLIVTSVIILLGIAVYLIARSHNLRKGVHFNAIFNAIPPE
jgi:amino acid transporter